jgi:hypothetical protein
VRLHDVVRDSRWRTRLHGFHCAPRPDSPSEPALRTLDSAGRIRFRDAILAGHPRPQLM